LIASSLEFKKALQSLLEIIIGFENIILAEQAVPIHLTEVVQSENISIFRLNLK